MDNFDEAKSAGDIYISLIETAKILQMDSLGREAIIKSLNVLTIKRIIKAGHKYFYAQDVYNVLNEAKEFFHKHYCYHEVIQIEGVTKGKLEHSTLEKVPIPHGFNAVLANSRFSIGKYKISRSAYNKIDFEERLPAFQSNIKKHLHDDEDDKNKYISLKEACKVLGMENLSKSIIDSCFRNFKIRTVILNRRNLYHIDDIEKLLHEVESFFDKYYTSYEVRNVLGIGYVKLIKSEIKQVRIPTGYYAVNYYKRPHGKEFRRDSMAFLKKDIDNINNIYDNIRLREKCNTATDISEFIPLKEVLRVTGFGEAYFREVVRISCDIRTYVNSNTGLLFHKEDIEELVVKQKMFYAEYIDASTALNEYPLLTYESVKKLKCYVVPFFALTNEKSLSIRRRSGVYKISEITQYIEDKEKNTVNVNIIENAPYKTFVARLNCHPHWNSFGGESQFSKASWFKYVENRLRRSKAQAKTLESDINESVRCTLLLQEMLVRNGKVEVFSLSANEINLFFRSIDCLTNQKILYRFLKDVFSEIQAAGDATKKCFKLSEIKIPPRLLPKTDTTKTRYAKEEIYNFEVYTKVFNYQLDINLHIMKSIKEIEEKGTATYASVWLYTMLHLNNAWRHGDVRDFPRIEIADILGEWGIIDITWLKDNRIELPLARAIVSRVIQWEFIISKTQMKGWFFCSDELAPSIATAIIILTLFGDKLLLNTSKTLMKFTSKFNEVSVKLLKEFFKDIDVKDFSFSSKKFNKSIMTYITYLSNMSGDNKSIEYAKLLRGHKKIGSTLHYIDFNIEYAEQLSRMLFARGEFGYITSLLVQKIHNGLSLSFEETTEQVCAVNTNFGDINKVNATVAFLNLLRSEREYIMNFLSAKSLRECQEMLSDIYTRSLPSKDSSDIQCMFSKSSCQRIDISECFECPFHIPTIYALSTLCDRIKHNINEYSNAENKAKNFKLSQKIMREKSVLIQAIEKFGKDYVYGCLGMKRDEFLDKLSMVEFPDIKMIDSIMGKDIEVKKE